MMNARQKILNYLIEQQSTTVDELARVFRVTPANIRHHLSILTTQGSVVVIGQKAPAYRGRPSQIYSCKSGMGNNLHKLAEILFSNLLKEADKGEKSHQLRVIANQMAAMYSLDKINPTRRLYSSMHILNQMNYQAHWEAHIEYPRIILGHCPYLALQESHPEICQMDRYMLEALLGAPVRQVEKLSPNEKCLPECVFLLQQTF
jgi:DeoR family suf operon transcriptional repressor